MCQKPVFTHTISVISTDGFGEFGEISMSKSYIQKHITSIKTFVISAVKPQKVAFGLF